MKLVAIMGSPHGMNGNTGMLLQRMLQGVRDAGAEVELISLSEKDVQPCRGCDACHITGECIIADDFADIRRAFEQADGLILASPNYIVSVTAQLKALLDRCSPLIHLQALEGKYAAAVVTSGGPGSDEVEGYLLRFLRSLGYATVGSVGAMGWQLQQDALRAASLQAAAALGARLVQAIAAHTPFPEQQQEREAMLTRMRQLVGMQKAHWPYEYRYWVDHHGMEE